MATLTLIISKIKQNLKNREVRLDPKYFSTSSDSNKISIIAFIYLWDKKC